MPNPQIFVHEKKPRWYPEMKRQFLDQEVRVRGVRRLNDVGSLISAAPGSLLLIDLQVGVGDSLRFVAQADRRQWPIRTLLVGDAKTRNLEWIARELGADHFVDVDIGGRELARLCRRYLG